jgi:hypothetical protein
MESFSKQIQHAERSAPCSAVPLPIWRNTISYHQILAPATSISQHCRIDSACTPPQGGLCPIPTPGTETPSDILKAGGYTHLNARFLRSWDTHQAAVCRGAECTVAPPPSPVYQNVDTALCTSISLHVSDADCWTYTYSSILKIETILSSETSVNFYHSTPPHILEYSTINPR